MISRKNFLEKHAVKRSSNGKYYIIVKRFGFYSRIYFLSFLRFLMLFIISVLIDIYLISTIDANKQNLIIAILMILSIISILTGFYLLLMWISYLSESLTKYKSRNKCIMVIAELYDEMLKKHNKKEEKKLFRMEKRYNLTEKDYISLKNKHNEIDPLGEEDWYDENETEKKE
jgi:hypothetical protein